MEATFDWHLYHWSLLFRQVTKLWFAVGWLQSWSWPRSITISHKDKKKNYLLCGNFKRSTKSENKSLYQLFCWLALLPGIVLTGGRCHISHSLLYYISHISHTTLNTTSHISQPNRTARIKALQKQGKLTAFHFFVFFFVFCFLNECII